ncbi:MAG: hypothetical protein KA198_10295, partial [Chitinophagaceae bacterium]|nr:hypothetical protein [Chitinophagaceae bacterium]
PIDSIANTAFSFVNAGSGFGRQFPRKLTNNGTGRNVGLELTLLRNFSNHYYYMINASVFDAKYKGSDQTLRNTTFNGRYLANLLFAKEFVINAKQTINFGGKISFAGGRWYGIVDTIASTINNEVVFTDKDFNTKQFKPYFRFDLKFNYKLNARGITHEIGLDLVNVLNIKNISSLTWAPNPADPSQSPIREEYQLGRLPLFYYRIDF